VWTLKKKQAFPNGNQLLLNGAESAAFEWNRIKNARLSSPANSPELDRVDTNQLLKNLII